MNSLCRLLPRSAAGAAKRARRFASPRGARRPCLLLAAIGLVAAACRPDPVVVISTHTPRPPAVSVRTVTPVPTDTATVPPSATHTPTSSATATPVTPTDSPTPTPTFTPTLTPTATYTRTPYPTKRPGATATPLPTFAPLAALPASHLWLARPIDDQHADYVEPTYRYGTTQDGTLPPHHGVEFYNPPGTPVLAAADGIVVFAGPDVATVLGPAPSFYGNTVVVELAQALEGQPVYNLYGHLSTIAVAPGRYVRTGEKLGEVGGTGVARGGPHLHFEVRVGYNDYASTRNPELWLRPYSGRGLLAGRVVDSAGRLIPLTAVTIRSEEIQNDTPVTRYLTTYAADTVNPDPAYGENFALIDLPPGSYTVSVNTTKIYRQTVAIRADQIAWVEFRDVNPPPTWTPTPTGTRPTATPSATATASPQPTAAP